MLEKKCQYYHAIKSEKRTCVLQMNMLLYEKAIVSNKFEKQEIYGK